MTSLISHKVNCIYGEPIIPGDKSISHRALIVSSQAVGRTVISGISQCTDVLCTRNALINLGVRIESEEDRYIVYGVGVGGLNPPQDVLYMGNSATSARLLIGLVSSYNFLSFFQGDLSLNKRPMSRVIEPLEFMGANFISATNTLPLVVKGSDQLVPINYTMSVSSAQVKSSILLAAINTHGITTINESHKSRDHTEIMLQNFKADLDVTLDKNNNTIIKLKGYCELVAQNIDVPADPSSAAFIVAACLMINNSEIYLKNVLINETRIGFYKAVQKMGGHIHFSNVRYLGGEKVADIYVKSSELSGISIEEEQFPSMVDEYPILSILAAYASGITCLNGLSELRIKESDRVNSIVIGLSKCGVKVNCEDDNICIYGTNGCIKGGEVVEAYGDHRIAMAFLVLGMVSKDPISIDNSACIRCSFPNFVEVMNELGANFSYF